MRGRVWDLADESGPAADGSGGVLVLAHSEKQDDLATWRKIFGHHPLVAFVDHGRAGPGPGSDRPPAAGHRGLRRPHHDRPTRPGTTPKRLWPGPQTLIRIDSGHSAHAFFGRLSPAGPVAVVFRRNGHHDAIHQGCAEDPEEGVPPTNDAGGVERPGAWVAETTDMPYVGIRLPDTPSLAGGSDA